MVAGADGLNGSMRIRVLFCLAIVVAGCSGEAADTSGVLAPATTTTTTEIAGDIGSGPATSSGPAPSSGPATTMAVVTSCEQADPDLALFCESVDLIHSQYVDPITDTALAEAAVDGIERLETGYADAPDPAICMVPGEVFIPVCRAIEQGAESTADEVAAALTEMTAAALDPNSAYLDPEALALAEEDTTGRVEGIGALVGIEDRTAADPTRTPCSVASDTCRLVVSSILDDSPAQRAGVAPGDEIVSVEGIPIEGLTFDEVTSRVRGPAGTEVTVGFLRGEEMIEFNIVRASVDLPVAEWELIDRVGYLRLNLFTIGSADQVRLALSELRAGGAERLVLDLRDNPGGALTAAVEIASQFLLDGLVLRTEAPGEETPYPVLEGGLATDLPVTVVINRGSASASEVVAGALQEAGAAVVVGENSYGKNTVQQRFSLSNGGALKLTIARWVTPEGVDFGGAGITPDVGADLPPDLTPAELVAEVAGLIG